MAVLGAVCGIDAGVKVNFPLTEVFDGDVGGQTGNADAGAAGEECVTEPSGLPSVPGPRVSST